MIKDIDYYEPIYQCLCSQYSEAYLKGSSFYVGNSLKEWWVNLSNSVVENRIKFKKYEYIKDILDNWISAPASIPHSPDEKLL